MKQFLKRLFCWHKWEEFDTHICIQYRCVKCGKIAGLAHSLVIAATKRDKEKR